MPTKTPDSPIGARRRPEPAATANASSGLPQFRKLWPADADAFEAHLLRLDDTDRRMRFCGSVGDAAIRVYCGRINWSRTTVLGCFIEGELRGAAELMRAQTWLPGDAELALTVERPFQDRGIGTSLLAKALMIARNRYITSVYMVCLLDNIKMQHIAGKFDADIAKLPGQAEGKIRPPWPSYLSFIEEAALDGRALFRATFDTDTRA